VYAHAMVVVCRVESFSLLAIVKTIVVLAIVLCVACMHTLNYNSETAAVSFGRRLVSL
jgi:hypothetical protein